MNDGAIAQTDPTRAALHSFGRTVETAGRLVEQAFAGGDPEVYLPSVSAYLPRLEASISLLREALLTHYGHEVRADLRRRTK